MQYTRQNPFYATLKSRACINRVTDAHELRQTWHVELDLQNPGIQYEPGDSLAILPANDVGQREKILAHLSN